VADLIEQNMIVRGSLNPAILQPKWLAEIGILEKAEKISARFPLGTNLAPEFQGKKYGWSVDYSFLKVNISPEESPVALRDFIFEVFSQLKHTPVTGVGQNFVFQETAWPKAINFSSLKNWEISGATKWGEIQNLMHEVKIGKDDKESINIKLNNDKEKSTIQFNFHLDVKSTEEVTEFSNKIEENYKLAQQIFEEIKK